MSPATLEQIESRAFTTIAESALARDNILRRPRSPQAISRAWRVIAGVRTLLAFTEPAAIEVLGEGAPAILAGVLRDLHDRLRALLKLSAERGLSAAPWFTALTEAIEDLADAVEALDLSADPEMRAAIEAAVAELLAARSTRSDAPVDWRAVLAQMSD